jgi:hypothetical protein
LVHACASRGVGSLVTPVLPVLRQEAADAIDELFGDVT